MKGSGRDRRFKELDAIPEFAGGQDAIERKEVENGGDQRDVNDTLYQAQHHTLIYMTMVNM